MIANISNSEKTASLHLPFNSIQLAGVLSYLGEDHLSEYDLPCNGEKKNDIYVSLEMTGIAERNIAEIARAQGVSLARLNSEIESLEAMPYAQKIEIMDKIASDRPETVDDVRHLIESSAEPTVITKFYCPLAVTLYVRNRWGDLEENGHEEDGCYAVQYADKIRQKMREFNAEDGDNMADYFSGNNSLRMKLRSVVWDFEKCNNELFGCISVETAGALTAEQERNLKDWIRGQNSDGLGESFEQREIKIDDSYRSSEIYVSLWQHDDDYFIDNENEFDERLNQRLMMGGM